MLSLAENILPHTPGVCAASSASAARSARRVSHLSDGEEPVATPDTADGVVRRVGGGEHESESNAEQEFDPAAWMPKNPRLAQLAEQIRQLRTRGQAPPPRCPSGLPELDAALDGGFVTAAVHELVTSAEGTAACSVALCIAAHAAGGWTLPPPLPKREGGCKWIFYIDTQQDFYPPGVARLGVPLGRLLVIRAPRSADALWVGEQALRCRAVAVVVLPLRTIDAYASRRLQLAAEAGGNLGLLLRSDERGGHTFAASRLRLEPLNTGCKPGPQIPGPGCKPTPVLNTLQAEPACPHAGRAGLRTARLGFPTGLVGCKPVPQALGTRRLLVTVLKLREGRPREPFVVELPDAADFVPALAVPADRTGAARRGVGG